MLESYNQEIIRKRRASRIFWLLVFSFATFLYFFFQGYYPSVNLSWKEYFSSGELRTIEREDLVRSFGIINIRVIPWDARILLSWEDLGNDEKKMVSYGKYRLSIGKPGYVQDWIDFSIDRETPYYIDEVSLIPQAVYTKGDSDISWISKISDDSWIAETGSGKILYDETFSSGKVVEPLGVHIGEGYYLEGRTPYRYSGSAWERNVWSGSTALIRDCDASLQVREWYLWCPLTERAIEKRWVSHTGVTQIGRDYIIRGDTLVSSLTSLALSEYEKRAPIFIEREKVWYIPSGGNFIPLVSQTGSAHPLITTPLDEISYADWVDGVLMIFGKRWPDTFLISIKDDKIWPLIPFPDIPLEEVRLEKYDGNIFIKTKNALLFLYNNSNRIEWITDGEILAYSPIAAIYRKDGEIWRAGWARDKI
jgi:hypothetical protein